MLYEVMGHGLKAPDYAKLKLQFLEGHFHLAANPGPFVRAYFCADAAIRNNLYSPIGK